LRAPKTKCRKEDGVERERGMPVAVDSSPLALPFYRSIWQVQLALSLKFSTAQWDGKTGIIISTLKII